MHVIRIRISDNIFEQVMRLLGKFQTKDLQIVHENSKLLSIQEYLQHELNKVEDGTAEYLTLEQLHNDLESTIKQYED